jgi:arylsulfatase A-like enzyme
MQPNLILLTVECWRADHFGVLTPNVLQLAQESVFFHEALTCGGWTRISMTALMSSAYASMHGGSDVALGTPARRTLAECLLENGYWTAGFTANPVCGTTAGFHRGFGAFRDVTRKSVLPAEAPGNWKTEWPRLLAMGIPPRDTQINVDARELTEIGLKWLEGRPANQPYFLWLHYLDPHWPCQMTTRPSTPRDLQDAWEDVDVFRNWVLPARGTFDPGADAKQRWINRYRESLTAVDSEIGRLLGELRARADWDRTIVAVTADHGEELFERGSWHHSWNQLHREGINVPLILRIPGAQRQSVAGPVGLIDLAPTLLDFAEIEPPATMTGRSLRSTIKGRSQAARPVFTEMMGHYNSTSYRLAIRDGEWKYIYDFDAPHNSKMFRVSEDPTEQVNLRDACPDEFRRLERMRLAHVTLGLTNLMERTRPDAIGAGRALSRAIPLQHETESGIVREQMEALGYL